MQFLTQHFSLEEFVSSDTATRRGIDNSLPPALIQTARNTCQMLERIRDYLKHLSGREIAMQITSGYRCLAVNRAIGSADSSDHVRAFAADFRAPSFGTPIDVAQALVSQAGLLGIGQLINEYPDRNGWVHVSTNSPAQAINRVITIRGDGTTAGIHK